MTVCKPNNLKQVRTSPTFIPARESSAKHGNAAQNNCNEATTVAFVEVLV